MRCPYPLSATSQRTLPKDYAGNAFIWDIDKTYLATGFSSLKGLARIPVEFAVDKRGVAGMAEVLRGIRRGSGPGFESAPLYFVSSSPPQLRPVIERKMLLDGVQPDGLIFKDWTRTLGQLRPGRLRDHVGFKLSALLWARQQRPLATEYLFGDDVESDAETYSLYARALAGLISSSELESVLVDKGVIAVDRRGIEHLLRRLPSSRGGVGRIFIHLARSTPPEQLERLGPLIAPVRGAGQLALALWELDLVDGRAVEEAIALMRREAGLDQAAIDARVRDAVDRGLVSEEKVGELSL